MSDAAYDQMKAVIARLTASFEGAACAPPIIELLDAAGAVVAVSSSMPDADGRVLTLTPDQSARVTALRMREAVAPLAFDLREPRGDQEQELAPAEIKRLRSLLGRVFADEVMALYSETEVEDGSGSVLRIYDLRCGGSGAQLLKPGETPGPVWRTE